jgi:purine-binding chemotaxis protein CheW
LSALQLATFSVDTLFLGVDISRVREIVRSRPVTHVPLAPPTVAGLMNLRGEILLALDLRALLRGTKVAAASASPGAMTVVVFDVDGAVGLLVDHVGDVLTVEEALFEPPPDTLQGPIRDLFGGAYRVPGRLLLRLELQRALRAAAPIPGRGKLQ